MKTYRIIATTDPYTASRHCGFTPSNDSRTSYHKVYDEGLTLKQANEKLFAYMREEYKWFPNWGLACICANKNIGGAGTNSDGTRWYRYDVFTYEVEEEL